MYFDVFRHTSRLNFRPSKQNSFYILGVFVDSRGREAPDKGIPEGLFLPISKKNCFHYRTSKESLVYVFRVFVHSRGGRSLVTCSWGSIVTFVDNVRILFFASQSRVHSMFLEFLYYVLLTKFWIWAIISFFPNRVGTLQAGYCLLDFQNDFFP